MKKIIAIAAILAAMCSCSLKENPTSFSNRENFYKTVSQCKAAVGGCYLPLASIYTADYMLVTEACTDLWHSGSTTTDACLDVSPAKPQFGAKAWRYGYQGVMRCNEVIECISASAIDDASKHQLVAEAKVLRAFYYYMLTCFFNGVPFYTCMVKDDNTLDEIKLLPRTDASVIRTSMYDELKELMENVYTEESGLRKRSSDIGDQHAGCAMCLMLMAKMAMWEKEWDKALYALNILEDIYGEFNEQRYPLEKTMWRYKNTDESIFEVQHYWSVTGTQYPGNVANIMMPPNKESETQPGVRLYDGVHIPELGNEATSWNGLIANNHYGIFRPKKGTAKEEQVVSHAIFPVVPLTYSDEFDEPDGRWYTQIDMAGIQAGIIRGKILDRRILYSFGFGNLETGETFGSTRRYGTGWGGPKFWCPGIHLSSDSNNYKIYRYADALLMKAECLAEKNESEAAVTYLNKIRTRAAAGDLDSGLSGEELLKEVRNERARELGGEFQRKYDLVRWGIWYDETLAYNTNSKIKIHIRPCHRYYPIPDTQCALSGYVLTNDEYKEE